TGGHRSAGISAARAGRPAWAISESVSKRCAWRAAVRSAAIAESCSAGADRAVGAEQVSRGRHCLADCRTCRGRTTELSVIGYAPLVRRPGGAVISAHIFISHATSDDAFVKELRNALEAHQLPAWVDSRNLRGGAELAPEINAAIEQA